MTIRQTGDDMFTTFVEDVEPRLRIALMASIGHERGREATAEALAYAWEHWERVSAMDNPAGYLYRVARSRTRSRRRRPLFEPVTTDTMPHVEPGLPAGIAALSEKQRVAVVMIHGYGWSRDETADLLGVKASTVDTHLLRGLAKLRNHLGVGDA